MRKYLAVLLLLCALTAFLWWENCTVETETVEIALPALPQAFDGLRLVVIADLHGRSFGNENEDLLAAVRDAAPDLICMVGDVFDADVPISYLRALCVGLRAIAPTCFVTGNHEWQARDLRSTLRDMEAWGVEVLRDGHFVMERGRSRIAVAGVDDPCGPLERKSAAAVMAAARREADFVCVLSHRNDELSKWAALDADLVLSGHCHGGIVRLPFLGGVFGADRSLFPDFDAGLYRQADTCLYVSRGLGFSRIPFRLFNRPHLPVLILRCKQSVNNSWENL